MKAQISLFFVLILVFICLLLAYFYRAPVSPTFNKVFNTGMDSKEGSSEGLRDVKVLAFGDSLTEGFVRGDKFHPYSIELEKRIFDRLAEQGVGQEVVMNQIGKSGEFTSHMAPRLRHALDAAGDQPYRLVCILGGTNDLSLPDSAEEIAGRLTEMYDIVLQHGTKESILVAITIPQSYFRTPAYVERRTGINNKIKEFAANANANPEHKDRIIVVDLEHILPYFGSDGAKDEVHWFDALHMTPSGYDKFGDIIYEHVKSVLDKK
jgi:lysophospholipase L1-like esterase